MGDPDWWQPLGEPGRMEVRELVPDESVHHRALATQDVREIALAEVPLLGRALTAEVGHQEYHLRDREDTIARLRLPAGKGRPWSVDVAGRELALTHERVDLPRGADAKEEQVLFLLLRDAELSWVAHYTGGRLAGEQFVLARGDVPRAASPVVTCVPAARSRDLPRPRRRQSADRHLTSWTAAATGAEVALAELLLLGRLHNGVDYLGASVVGAAREIAGIWRVFTPAPDALPTKRGD